ncbi:MAG: Unknown protein [uncultured Sulfurovum sp.]|uniref:DUF3015 domain-containing protein n=1 Tax=uncultured Sulfurovum sp. TaxID=269237 RepID=A0A6S6T1N0_9BACT|nr:MAG: Unknown protein [uncultured Sulfurovum sp.]
MKKIAISLATAALMASSAQATTFEHIVTKCGLGPQMFENSQTMAVVSNVLFGLYSMTTTTSQMASGSCKNVKVAMFVAQSHDNLELEIAKGQGEYLDTLSELSNKSVETLRAEYATVLKSNNLDTMNKQQKISKLFDIATN